MEKRKIYLIVFILAVIAFLFAKLYMFNIYEVVFEVKPSKLYADNQSMLEIKTVPLNAFGWKAPFRDAYTEFEIREGDDLIYVVKMDKEKGRLVIRAKDKPGKVVIYAKSKFALLPSVFEIEIELNAV
jgi:hypothetical protein